LAGDIFAEKIFNCILKIHIGDKNLGVDFFFSSLLSTKKKADMHENFVPIRFLIYAVQNPLTAFLRHFAFKGVTFRSN
jgi:hypothetical protein